MAMHIWTNASKSDWVPKIGSELPLSKEKWPLRCPMDERLPPLPFYEKIKEISMDLHSRKIG
ncbi:hypothetical protein EJB05_30202, partial [Eragrostis curvula]